MRRAMAAWWPRLLWPGVNRSSHARGHGQSAFDERHTNGADAFTSLVEVLRRRLARDEAAGRC